MAPNRKQNDNNKRRLSPKKNELPRQVNNSVPEAPLNDSGDNTEAPMASDVSSDNMRSENYLYNWENTILKKLSPNTLFSSISKKFAEKAQKGTLIKVIRVIIVLPFLIGMFIHAVFFVICGLLFIIYNLFVSKFLHRDSLTCLNDGLLTSTLWTFNKENVVLSYIKRITYLLIPFILSTTLFLVVNKADAFNSQPGFYSFSDDYSDCYMLLYVFVFMFFVSGAILKRFNDSTDSYISNHLRVSSFSPRIVRGWFSLLSIFFVLGAQFFVLFPQNHNDFITTDNSVSFWYNKLNNVPKAYYFLLVSMSWYMAARLFLHVLINSIALYLASEKSSAKVLNDEHHKDASVELSRIKNYLAASLGFGLYFLIAIGIILYSDYTVANSSLELIFAGYEYFWHIIFITLILSVFYFGTIILSYNSVSKHSESQSFDNDYFQKKLPRLNAISSFLLSIVFPIITAIIQFLTQFKK